MADNKLKLFYSKCSNTEKRGSFPVSRVEQMPDGKESLLLGMYCSTTVSCKEHILNLTVDKANTRLRQRVQRRPSLIQKAPESLGSSSEVMLRS